jgi:hypothetical protein
MHREIRNKLEQIAKRFRSQVLAWLLIGLWGVFLALLLGRLTQTGNALAGSFSWGLLVATAIGGYVLFFLWTRFGYRDLGSVAQRIERRFPDIDQKLLTAIEPIKPNESEFLRSKLIEETLLHAQSQHWDTVVPRWKLGTLWSLQWLLLGATIAASWMLQTKSTGVLNASDRSGIRGFEWTVEPGSTQIEKGSDLLVSVRFSDDFSDDLLLIAESPGGESQSVSMQRSLRDPIASATIRKVKEPLRYRIESISKNSERFEVAVFEHPAVLQSDASIQSPTYAQQDDKTISNTRRVSIVDGAQIRWSLKLNKPVVSAEWIDENGQSALLEGNPQNPTEYSIRNTPTESMRYRLKLTDAEGRSEKTTEEFVVKVIPNREPELKLISAVDQRVSAIQEMIVGARVQDDFGIHRTGIRISVGDSEPSDIELSSPGEPTKKKNELQHLIDLESLQAKADQLVTYHFWTEDLDRNGQPRRIESEMYFAEVRPFEETFREVDASATQQRQEQQQQGSESGQQAEELAELQKKILSATWNLLRGIPKSSTDASQSVQEQLPILLESQNQALEQTEALKEQLQAPNAAQDLFKVQSSMREAIAELNQSGSETPSIALRGAIQQMRGAYEGLLRLRAREHEVSQSQQQQSSSQRSQSASQRNRQEQIQQLQLEQDPSRYEEESQPMTEEASSERETRQVMNRLDELARRQEDLNEQVRELDLALQSAKDEQEKKELEERLEQLREDQQELVEDADELLERMNEPESRNALEESRRQIENAREQMQQSERQLREAQPSAALNSGTRAEQSVDQTREQLREQSSESLQRDVQKLIEQAQKVAKNQAELERQLREQANLPARDSESTINGPDRSEPTRSEPEANSPRRESLLRSDAELNQQENSPERNLEDWKEQKQQYLDLLNRIKDTVEQAEGSEPLLAEQLYETYRDASRLPTEQRLDRIPMMIQRGMEQPAVEESGEVSKELQGLRERIENSAQSVLGSEEESLRRAIKEIDQANRAIESEIEQRLGQDSSQDANAMQPREGQPREGQPSEGQPSEGQPSEGQPSEGQPSEGQPSEGQPREGQPSEGQPREGQPREGQPSEGQPREGQPREGQPREGQPREGQPREGQPREGQPREGQPREGQPSEGQPSEARRSSASGESSLRSALDALEERMQRAGGGGGLESSSPLMGEDYVQWTDRLRDIEELVRDPELKAEAARVREAARDFRKEYKRHSKEPQWELVKKLISNPLQELQRRVQEELIRKTAKENELVPLDSDPVPDRFRSELDRYFERLGGEQTK